MHTNLIARDWRVLARLCETLFGCEPVPPERDLSRPAMDSGTRLAGPHLRGVHRRLPGYGKNGQTLQIFTYEQLADPASVGADGAITEDLRFDV